VVSPAGIPKTFQHKHGGDFLVVHLSPSLLIHAAEELTTDDPAKVELINNFGTRDQEIERLVLGLWNEHRNSDLASRICAEAIGNQLAVQLLRRHSTLRKPVQPSNNKLSPKMLKRAFDYIENNLANDLTVQEIARAVPLSAGHFAHAFSTTVGTTPHRYVLERRIELTKALLRETDLPIANIATRAGFARHSHFCATFQRLTGFTASEFRRSR